MTTFFMTLTTTIPLGARHAPYARSSIPIQFLVPAAAGAGGHCRHVGAPHRGRLLHAAIVDDGLAIVEQRPQFAVLRRREIALRLDDKEVGGQPDFESALFRREARL